MIHALLETKQKWHIKITFFKSNVGIIIWIIEVIIHVVRNNNLDGFINKETRDFPQFAWIYK